MELLFSIALGISLAATCGLRAFLPLFLAGASARWGGVPLTEAFQWLAGGPALAALSVAVVVEIAADKVPAVDHVLDLIQGPVRTIAGGVVAAAVVAELPGWATALVAIVAGSGAALTVHSAKSLLRLGSTATTAGLANPLLSLGEDVVCFLTAVLSLLLWVVAALVAAAAVGVAGYVVVRLVRRRRAPRPAADAA